MTYTAPLADMRFVLEEVAGLDELAALPGYEAADRDLVDAVLDEAAKLAGNELAPLNQPADRVGSVLENGVVRTPPGFREAYAQYVEGGWNGLTADPEYGGQGLPLALAAPVTEMWNSACMAFALCPLLTLARSNCCRPTVSDEQKQRYLGRLVSGEWTGTMNLTEPQAGSDLGALTNARGAGPRSAMGRALPDHRAEDLHHLWRPRSGAEHRPRGAGAHARCAARQPRHLAVPGAEIPARRRRPPGAAQRRSRR